MCPSSSGKFSETFVFDDPIAFQIVKEVLDRMGYKYQEPEFEADEPIFMLEIDSPLTADHVARICFKRFEVQRPMTAASFNPFGGMFSSQQVWDFKLLGVKIEPASIPAIVEELVSSAPPR